MRASYNESSDDRSGSAREVRCYPNRRMYDTRSRAYVALSEIAQWIDEGQRVRVLDVKSDEDVTIEALLPLLLERLPRTLLGAEGVARLHQWIREGIASAPEPAPEPAPPATPMSTEERVASLEARVAALEAARASRS